MITVKIGKKERVYRATTKGHAEGNPIACAATTCLMNTLRGSIENLTETGVKKYRVDKGIFDVKYIAQDAEDDALAAVLFNNAIIGMLQLQETYPEQVKFIK